MKVYVCESEDPFEGRNVVAVFDNLDSAQLLMRKYHGNYILDGGCDEDVRWYDGKVRKWGWFNDCCSYGFYIEEHEVMGGLYE